MRGYSEMIRIWLSSLQCGAAFSLGISAVLASPAQAVESSSKISNNWVLTPDSFSSFVPGTGVTGRTQAQNSLGELDTDADGSFGTSLFRSLTVSSAVSGASAIADAAASIKFGPSAIGNTKADTLSTATNGFGAARANASSRALALQRQSGARGRIQYNPLISINSTWNQGTQTLGIARDQVNFSIFFGELTAGATLFESNISLFDGNGSINWKEGIIEIDSFGGENDGLGIVQVGLNTQFITNGGGFIDFAYNKGIVIRSSCAGIFCNIFPMVGEAAAGSYSVGLIDFDYNLFTSGNDVLWRFESESFANAVPEPSSWAMLIVGFGLIGFTMRRRAALG